MNTLTEFYNNYKLNENLQKSRIILCNWRTQDGIQINGINEFDIFINTNKKEEFYILNQIDTEDLTLLEYFQLEKAEPTLVTIKHPLMTNAFWKEIPDKIIDVVVNEGIYRYSMVTYGKNLKEYVIEFPSEINPEVINYCKNLLPKSFKNKPSKNQNISLLFTNTNRYTDLDRTNFVIYNLKEIYPEWNVKTINTLNLSRKLWDNIKNILSEKKIEL